MPADLPVFFLTSRAILKPSSINSTTCSKSASLNCREVRAGAPGGKRRKKKKNPLKQQPCFKVPESDGCLRSFANSSHTHTCWNLSLFLFSAKQHKPSTTRSAADSGVEEAPLSGVQIFKRRRASGSDCFALGEVSETSWKIFFFKKKPNTLNK